MKIHHSIFGVLSGVMALILLAAPLQADVKIKSRMVDCDKGQDPAEVLNQELGPQRLEMTLVGTCPGFTVSRDDVRVEGDDEYGCPATTGSVSGTIRFEGAQRAVVACLQVTGDGSGIEARNGSNVTVIDSDISFNNEGGIDANQSSLKISNTTITHNGTWTAINIQLNSSLDIEYSNVSNNSGSAAFVGVSSSLSADNVHFTDNGERGIVLAINSSALIGGGGSFQGHSLSGILVKEHSLLDIRDTAISNNPRNGIEIAEDGGVILRSGVTISGNGVTGIWCADGESSFLNADSVFIEDPVECTGFD